MRFVTSPARLSADRTPALDAAEGSELYRSGWRMDESSVADGPGGSTWEIIRGSERCLVSRSQPAHVDERTGKIIQEETLTIVVQCRKR